MHPPIRWDWSVTCQLLAGQYQGVQLPQACGGESLPPADTRYRSSLPASWLHGSLGPPSRLGLLRILLWSCTLDMTVQFGQVSRLPLWCRACLSCRPQEPKHQHALCCHVQKKANGSMPTHCEALSSDPHTHAHLQLAGTGCKLPMWYLDKIGPSSKDAPLTTTAACPWACRPECLSLPL